ncbi:MAG: hypothetical protein K9N46_09935 [Candidatus Marinimicrobia bacterium]|nr:hypothetical protein [Candidatus Neomarinimicrobiota bacterium]MCF7828364.1 hypothetical protein [Candidatus Neomarinimicrobiota bacterium]MCF7881043.1 hypothetical protein [Candidatus Neomarinimicrobiota bacterium]
MKIDAEKGNGVNLAKQFNVRGYPTTVFVNRSGEEVDRIVGYLPIKRWLEEIQRINQGKNTYQSLEEQVDQNPEDSDLLIRFAEKVEQRNRTSERIPELWQRIRSLTEEGSEQYIRAEFKIAQYQAMATGKPSPLQGFIDAYPEAPQQMDAYNTLLSLHRNAGNIEQEIETFQAMVKTARAQGEVTPSLLNGYAWRMAELDTNLKDALAKAEQAVEMTKSADPQTRAQILDTQAEVLWKLGQTAQAVKIINKCIELQPDDEYFKKQKNKFMGESSGV